jgi:hypothetical protein
MAEPTYDVAISFLSADENIASALTSVLSKGLSVFFYPTKQQETAGADGLEKMRKLYSLETSRVVVVLFRKAWGETQWTGVEDLAIRDRCLKDKFKSVFFLRLDKSALPQWVPETYVSFNYDVYGLDQAVGAIKARVQELGGLIQPESITKRAERYRLEREYQSEREGLKSPNGWSKVRSEALKLFAEIKTRCEYLRDHDNIPNEFAIDERQFHLRNNRVSLMVTMHIPELAPPNWTTELMVREFDKRLEFQGEPLLYDGGGPREVSTRSFHPELSRAHEQGWTPAGEPSFLSSQELAETIVIQFIDLIEKADQGSFQRVSPHSRAHRRAL